MDSIEPSLDEEQRTFLQRRVAMFALLVTAIGGFGSCYWLVLILARRLPWSPDVLFMVPAPFVMLGLWAYCRRGRRSARRIHFAEAATLLLVGLLLELMMLGLPVAIGPHFLSILVATHVVMARAIYVPSSARRTLALTAVLGIPLLPITYLTYRDAAGPADLQPTSVWPLAVTAGAAVVGTMTTALATATSKILYGLRREVREAQQLGQYVLEEKLGEGGMGVVYHARHAMLRRPTAVKLLAPSAAGGVDMGLRSTLVPAQPAPH